MSTTYEYSVRHGDKVTHKTSTLAGVVRELTPEDLVKHIEKTDLHRGPDEIFDIRIVAHNNQLILPLTDPTLSAVVSGSTLKDSRVLLNQQRTATVYKTTDGTDVTPGKQPEPTPTTSSPENDQPPTNA